MFHKTDADNLFQLTALQKRFVNYALFISQ